MGRRREGSASFHSGAWFGRLRLRDGSQTRPCRIPLPEGDGTYDRAHAKSVVRSWQQRYQETGRLPARTNGPDAPRVGVDRPMVVYFVHAAAVGRIKIGVTADLGRRLNLLRMASPVPLDLLAAVPGGFALERALHERFAAHRLHGEWFESTAELVAYIGELGRG